MKIGVLADVHSNILALRAVTDALEAAGCEEYFLLGDFVSDTPYTADTMAYLKDFINGHKCHVLRGNREEYMLLQREYREAGDEKNIWLSNSASGNLLHAYEQLTEEDLGYFQRLPISFCFHREGYPDLFCCHGSPQRTKELLQLGSGEAQGYCRELSEDYLICAHTHYPGVAVYGKKHHLNPGSVGIAIGDVGFAQCMILESFENPEGEMEWRPQFRKVPYDEKKVIQDILTSGLGTKGHWYVNCNLHIFTTGVDVCSKVVERAGRMEKEQATECGEVPGEWPHIRESCFERAAAEYHVPDYVKEFLEKQTGLDDE